MKWTLEELEAATRPIYKESGAKIEALNNEAHAKVDAILEEAGWTRWEWAEETEPGCMGAGPFLRNAEKKASKLRKLIKGLHIIYKYDPNATLYIMNDWEESRGGHPIHHKLYVGDPGLFEKMSFNDKTNLEQLHDFIYDPAMNAWYLYISNEKEAH